MLYTKKNNNNQNADEDSCNLSTTSINNCETSENNVIRTTETPDNNAVKNDDLADQHGKRNFQPTPHHSNTVQLKPNLIIKKTPLE